MVEGQCQQACKWYQWFFQMVELVMFCKFLTQMFSIQNSFSISSNISHSCWACAVSSLAYRSPLLGLGESIVAMVQVDRQDEEAVAVMKAAEAGDTDPISVSLLEKSSSFFFFCVKEKCRGWMTAALKQNNNHPPLPFAPFPRMEKVQKKI